MDGEEPELASAIVEVQRALERLRIASLSSPAGASASAAPEWELVSAGPAGQLPDRVSSARSSPLGYPSAGPPSPRPSPSGYPSADPNPAPPVSRSDTEASFADCPQYCLDLCCRLTAGPLSSEARAKRAWRAGKWAAEVLAGRWATPLSSAPLAVKPVCYVVLRSGRLDRPARFATFAALRRAIGEISGSDSVLHSFGSLAEARVYCYAAGVPFPDLLQ